MSKIFGVVLILIGGLPLLLLPPVVIWAVLECGPAASSCHHPPYRLAVAAAVCATLIWTGWRMLTRGGRRG